MSLSLEPIWPWPLVIILAAALAALVAVSYRSQADRLPSLGRRRTVLGLKLAAVLVLLFAMFRPAVQFAETTENTAQILLLRDVSRSMNTPDGPGGKSRFQVEQDEFRRLEDVLAKLGSRVEVRKFDFSRGLAPFSAQATEGTGEQTAIGQTLLDVLKETQDRRTLAILMASDGAHRAMPPNDADPLSAAQQLAEIPAPVYPIGIGASAISEAALDLALEDLLVDPVVFQNKLVPVKVRLRAAGAKGRTATVRVLVEKSRAFGLDPKNGKFHSNSELVPAGGTQNARPVWEGVVKTDKESQPIELTFVPQQAGELKIAVEVVPAEGELLTRNNRVETIISVRQGGVKVAYFDILRMENKSLNMVNGADKIQLDRYLVFQGKFAAKTRFAEDVFDRGKYDVYIIGDVPARVFGPALLKNLAKRLEEGASLLMIGGNENFSAGGYADSPIEEYVPINLNSALARPDSSQQAQIVGRLQMMPTTSGLQQYVMQIDVPEKNRARWQALPKLVGVTRLEPKHELVRVWAEADDGTPLLMATEVGRSRVAAFAGDSTWRWVLHGEAEAHQRFWRQLLLWLARKDADTDQAVWANVEPRNYLPGSSVTIRFGARTAEGAPLEDAEFDVEMVTPKDERIPLTPRKAAQDFLADAATTAEPGDYWVRVTGKHQGKLLGPPTNTRFIVDPRDLELDHPSADYDLLRQIATITGGALLKPEDLEGWATRLTERKFGDLTQVRVVTLWDNWWALLAFVGLMTTEWVLRKRWGLV